MAFIGPNASPPFEFHGNAGAKGARRWLFYRAAPNCDPFPRRPCQRVPRNAIRAERLCLIFPSAKEISTLTERAAYFCAVGV